MELLILIAFPLLAAAVHAIIREQKRTFLISTSIYSLALIYIGGKGLFSPLNLDAGSITLWGDFVMVPSFHITAINAPMILLLGLTLPFVSLLLRTMHSGQKSYAISAWFFLLGLAGTFLADSLILFYVFFEMSLIGAYFWIGLFGSRETSLIRDSRPGLTRFFLFTLVGSLCMLVSIAALSSGGRDLRWTDLPVVLGSFSDRGRFWIFLGFLAAFAVKLPMFGLHGWLRETYSIAPPAARALLSAVMSKLGAYGLVLLAVYFGGEFREHSRILSIIFTAGVLYGGIISLTQKRLLDVVIYSSLSHLNLIGLGLATTTGGVGDTSVIAACVLQMLNHGLIMAAILVYDARLGSPLETREGLREHARILAAFLLVALFAAVSLPGLSSFPAEFLILFSVFTLSPAAAFISILGLLISAAALIRSYHRIFLGPFRGFEDEARKAEIQPVEALPALLFAGLWIVVGLMPGLLLNPVAAALGMIKP